MGDREPDPSVTALSSPTQARERNPAIDILRGFAVFGILLVNFPGSDAARSSGADDTVRRLLSIFVSGKFYTTFSFLFGLGFALQLLRAQARGRRVAPIYIRRMLALFLIGFCHAVLVWQGDVLLIYAFMGLFLIPLRRVTPRILLPLAALFLVGEYVGGISEEPLRFSDVVPRLADPQFEQQTELQKALAFNDMRDAWRQLRAATKTGSYFDAVTARFNVWRLSNQFVFRYVWLTSFAMFLLGLCAGRSSLLRSPPERPALIRRVMWISLPIWIVCGVLTAYGPQLLGPLYFKIHWKALTVAWVLQGPAGSLCYISAFWSLLAARPGWISKLAPLGAVGRMPLSNYLFQSVCGTLLYYGYGVNLQLVLGNLSSFLLAIGVFAAQIALSRYWLARFQFGPFEWLWRALTYGALPAMRPRQAAGQSAAST